jgi:Uma2 family endonuclease
MTAAERLVTLSEYLAAEELATERSEYYNGRVYAMAGGSPEHARISGNAHIRFGVSLGGSTCDVFGSDLRISVEETGLHTYPDLSIVCGEVAISPSDPHAITNPNVIVEVLSASMAAYDRGAKFLNYRRIPSLKEYVLIEQDRPCVEVYTRQEGDAWLLRTVEGLEGSVRLDSLNIDLPMADIYRKVVYNEALQEAAPDDGDAGPTGQST